jgi:hypothetical protein
LIFEKCESYVTTDAHRAAGSGVGDAQPVAQQVEHGLVQ